MNGLENTMRTMELCSPTTVRHCPAYIGPEDACSFLCRFKSICFFFSHSKKCSNTNGNSLLKPVVFYKFNFHSNVNMFMRNVHFVYCLKMGPQDDDNVLCVYCE